MSRISWRDVAEQLAQERERPMCRCRTSLTSFGRRRCFLQPMTMTAGCAPNHWDRDYALGCDYVAEAEAEGRRFATIEEMVRWARLRVPFASVGGGRRSRPGLEHKLPPSGGGDEVLHLHSPVAGRTEILYRHLDGPWKWAGECEAGDLLCRLLALVDGQSMYMEGAEPARNRRKC
jgi:hypothetical protein